ncbi:MAG: putative hydroxymethylpyrimidine transporter CytX [Desulfitobacteriaceae bacterium]|nr:putative hydroxymethylpyrimidine transporter CytX [Desulfitobacteriaceae bacterium]
MDNTIKTTSFSQTLLWFGAAISIAEILTGALIAPLGLFKGTMAIVLGHIIGAVVFYMTGYIGAESRLSAIGSTRISFGKYGSYLFGILNILQLLGWTAVMIINGAIALDSVTKEVYSYQNITLWCILIGALICIWIILGIKNLSKVNIFAVGALFILTIILGFTVFSGTAANNNILKETLSFGAAVELSVVMPLSWLPLISDYTRHVKNEKAGTLSSTLGYFAGSTFMYIIGLGSALYAGTSDVFTILISAGLGLTAFLIVILSTVTTTYLDAYSAGVSFVNISKNASEKLAAIIVCIIGVALAIYVPTNQYENFLYLIGSVFAPLFAILITDYYILKVKTADENSLLNLKNILIWAIGVIGYRMLMPYNSIIGVTLPVMLGIGILCIIINGGMKRCLKKF